MTHLDLHFAPGGDVSSWEGGDGAGFCLSFTRLLDLKGPPVTELSGYPGGQGVHARANLTISRD